MEQPIHIFCIVGEVKCGKRMYIEEVLKNHIFTKRMNLAKLIYGTTRKIRSYEEYSDEFQFVSNEEYDNLDKESLIEFRSYYTLTEGIVYYFTKKEHINVGKNLICVTSPYQYEMYKYWISRENIKNPGKYQLHMIYIVSDLKSRFYHAMNKITKKDELYELCRRVLQDKSEFENLSKRLPELIDPMMHNVCYIHHDHDSAESINNNIDKIKKYIEISIKGKIDR